MSIVLRDYQEDAVLALFDYFGTNSGNPLLELPTGAGKSILLAEIIRRAIEQYKPTRVIMLTHVKELIEQNYRALCTVWEGTPPAGIYSAGLGLRDMGDQIVFASIQSAVNDVEGFGPRDLIFVDEAHRIPRSGNGQYLEFITRMRQMNPSVKVIGLTATPYRMDGGYLHKGSDRIFTDIAYCVSIRRLIEGGYLSPVVSKEPGTGKINTSSVKMRGGDFAKGELANIATQSRVDQAVAEMVTLGREQGRKSWLVFACGVEHARQIMDNLDSHGVVNAGVFGDTSAADRKQFLERYQSGKIQCIVNCDVLTTGFDAPGTDLVALMRPTESTSLYVQMVGRGLRIAEGKENALILDYGGNVRRHGPIDNVSPTMSGRGNEISKVKECGGCGFLVPREEPRCPECDYIFSGSVDRERREAEHDAEADTAPVLQGANKYGLPEAAPPRELTVLEAFAERHEKEGKATSMKVSYITKAGAIREWVCFEHRGFARTMAEKWWKASGGMDPVPFTVEEGMKRFRRLPPVQSLMVTKDGKYDEIASKVYDPDSEPELTEEDYKARGYGSSSVMDFDECPF